MKNKSRFLSLLIVTVAGVGIAAASAEDEGIFLDPVTGDYTIRYIGLGGVLGDTTFYPHTKIDPTIKSNTIKADDGSIRYRYKVRNGEKSKQNLISLWVGSQQVIANSQNAPPGWDPSVSPISSDHPLYGKVGSFVSWGFVRKLASSAGITSVGLLPGASEEFQFGSTYLPGVGIMSLRGDAPVTAFPDEGPSSTSAVADSYQKLRQNDFVSRDVMAPRVVVPSPYNTATVLTNIRQHLDADLVNLKLVDPTLVTELDRWLAAAIAAAKTGNDKALRSDIHEARKLLKQEREDVDKDDSGDQGDTDMTAKTKSRIDRLAARVLDFDLRYVESRIQGKDHD